MTDIRVMNIKSKNSVMLLTVMLSLVLFISACGGKTGPESSVSGNSTPENSAQAGLANPWTEVSAEYIEKELGFSFGVPEDAGDVIYRWMESGRMAEMDFTLDGTGWTARVISSGEYKDISGLHYSWNKDNGSSGETVIIESAKGQLKSTEYHVLDTGNGTVVMAGWFDSERGLVLSLAAITEKGASDVPCSEVFAP